MSNKTDDLRKESGTADILPLNGTKARETADFTAQTALYSTGTALNSEILFITGSENDARSIEKAGAAAVAKYTGSETDFVNFISDWKAWQFEQGAVVICLKDQDKATALLHDINDLNIKGIVCDLHAAPAELAAADFAQFTQQIHDAQKKAIAAHIPDDLDAFIKTIQTDAYKPNKTGIDFLDDLLSGGVIKQTLTLLMAAPGAGKTTLCQQTAEAIAATGKPVIFLNLEMSKEQMLAKSICRRLAEKGHDIDTLKVLQGYSWTKKERELITAEVDSYRQSIYKYLQYNPDGISSRLEAIRDYLTAKGEQAKADGTQAPAVILDYLHLVSSDGLDAQELIKQTVTMLKEYAIKYDSFIIAIVAVNRESMKKGQLSINSARDSSTLEYTADYIITLNYYGIDNGTADPQKDSDLAELRNNKYWQMILRLPKARFGKPGKYAKVYFNAAGSYFLPIDGFIPDGAEPFDDPLTEPRRKY